MTPARTNGLTGSFRFDLVFRGVGRIRNSAETENLREFRDREALLRKLYKAGHLDILAAFRDKRLTIQQLVDADRHDKTRASLESLLLAAPLWSSVADAIGRMRCGPKTKQRYVVSWAALQAKAGKGLGPTAKVRALETMDWDALKNRWDRSGDDWLHLRRAVSRTLTVMLGDKFHPVRRRIMAAFPTARRNKRVPNVTPDLFARITARTPEHLQPAYWTLVLTGMRVITEYLACNRSHLVPELNGVNVPGTKTEGSEGLVRVAPHLWHWIEAGIPSRVQYKRLREAWARACLEEGVKVRLHDLRHCHGQWALNAGALEASVQVSLRHSNPDQTRDYTRQVATGEVASALGRVFPAPIQPQRSRRRA